MRLQLISCIRPPLVPSQITLLFFYPSTFLSALLHRFIRSAASLSMARTIVPGASRSRIGLHLSVTVCWRNCLNYRYVAPASLSKEWILILTGCPPTFRYPIRPVTVVVPIFVCGREKFIIFQPLALATSSDDANQPATRPIFATAPNDAYTILDRDAFASQVTAAARLVEAASPAGGRRLGLQDSDRDAMLQLAASHIKLGSGAGALRLAPPPGGQPGAQEKRAGKAFKFHPMKRVGNGASPQGHRQSPMLRGGEEPPLFSHPVWSQLCQNDVKRVADISSPAHGSLCPDSLHPSRMLTTAEFGTGTDFRQAKRLRRKRSAGISMAGVEVSTNSE
jgi:hypothetical protein